MPNLDTERLQADYYARTATDYDQAHGRHPEHDRALEVLSQYIAASGATSVLDVGTGTGRAIRHLAERHPNLHIAGVDPVPELLEIAVDHGVDRANLSVGSGDALAFPDRSFDVVCEFGVLHHVRDPAAVVREMQRVARHAVFISDANRFGQGGRVRRVLKLVLYKAHLWWPVVRVRNRGRRHYFSEGDGLAYSYSVYDNLEEFCTWDSVSLVVTMRGASSMRRTWLHPLLTSPHLALCAVRSLGTLPR